MASYVIVGAGIIGAAIAERLASQGETVLILDGGLPGATAASFGWINASHYLDEAHFRLREAGLKSWHETADRLGLELSWPGCLTWGEDIDAQERALKALGYPVERLSPRDVAALEPALAPISQDALRFSAEGVAEAPRVADALTKAACAAGAQLLLGQRVVSVLADDGRAIGVETDAGLIFGDHTVLAMGTGTPALLAPLGIDLPMKHSPADMVITRATTPMLTHILATPEREIRQDAEGRFWVPSTPKHQEISGQEEAFDLEAVADASLNALATYLPGAKSAWETVLRGHRPMPKDGLPVVGPTGVEGLYVATLHSGVTLAALVGDLVAKDLREAGPGPDILSPYRLSRFSQVEEPRVQEAKQDLQGPFVR
ncbi:MAG: FAD-binding oxidoreductase [Pseudomonadota bacterium]